MPIYKTHTGPMSGFNMFLMRNLNRYSAGITPLTNIMKDAPLGLPRPEGFKTVSVTATANSITFSWTLINNVPKTDRFKLWIRSVDAKVHPQLVQHAPMFPESSITITTVKSVSGIPISLPPGRYELQAQVINVFGKTGVDSERLQIRIGPDNFNFVEISPAQTILGAAGLSPTTAWATISLLGIIHPMANAIQVMVELLKTAGVPGNLSEVQLRRDSTQGVCLGFTVNDGAIPSYFSTDSGIIPVTSLSSFDWRLTGPAGAELYSVNIYLLGYYH